MNFNAPNPVQTPDLSCQPKKFIGLLHTIEGTRAQQEQRSRTGKTSKEFGLKGMTNLMEPIQRGYRRGGCVLLLALSLWQQFLQHLLTSPCWLSNLVWWWPEYEGIAGWWIGDGLSRVKGKVWEEVLRIDSLRIVGRICRGKPFVMKDGEGPLCSCKRRKEISIMSLS